MPPEVVESGVTRGSGFQFAKAEELTRQWREEAAQKGQSILEFARAKSGSRRGAFTGSYDAVADRLVEFARLGAIDGLNITPWLIPSGLDDIVDHLIPRLQERASTRPSTPARRCARTWASPRSERGRAGQPSVAGQHGGVRSPAGSAARRGPLPGAARLPGGIP